MGKVATLNALTDSFPRRERVIICEELFELTNKPQGAHATVGGMTGAELAVQGALERMEFWSVTATTLPVLALALLLEARWMLANGDAVGFPAMYVRWSSASSGLMLLTLGVGEIVCLMTLMTGTDTDAGRVSMMALLAFATALVILAPGLALLRVGSANWLAALTTLRLRASVRWRLARLKRRIEANRRRKTQLQLRLYELGDVDSDNAEIVRTRLAMAGSAPKEWAPYVLLNREWLKDYERRASEALDLYNEVEVTLWEVYAMFDAVQRSASQTSKGIRSARARLAEVHRLQGTRLAHLPSPPFPSRTGGHALPTSP